MRVLLASSTADRLRLVLETAHSTGASVVVSGQDEIKAFSEIGKKIGIPSPNFLTYETFFDHDLHVSGRGVVVDDIERLLGMMHGEKINAVSIEQKSDVPEEAANGMTYIDYLEARISELTRERDAYDERMRAAMDTAERWRVRCWKYEEKSDPGL
jgi:hypothetical protein